MGLGCFSIVLCLINILMMIRMHLVGLCIERFYWLNMGFVRLKLCRRKILLNTHLLYMVLFGLIWLLMLKLLVESLMWSIRSRRRLLNMLAMIQLMLNCLMKVMILALEYRLNYSYRQNIIKVIVISISSWIFFVR